MPDTLPDEPGLDVRGAAEAFAGLVGPARWRARVAEIGRLAAGGQRSGRATLQRHAIELALDRLTRPLGRPPSAAERRVAALAAEAVRAHAGLQAPGRARMKATLRAGLTGPATLLPAFHLFRTAALQRRRGFRVDFAGFAEGAPFDLLIARDGTAAEVACDVLSAEEGRGVHRFAWARLVDRIDPDLQRWLADHPGRYLLKLTLPQGLRTDPADQDRLAALHQRIRALLETSRRADQDEAAVLRLDPLMLAASQWEDGAPAGPNLLADLRRAFGPEAHLAVTAAGGGVFVMAARAAREDEVAAALRRRLASVAPARLTGTRPGILAMFIEDTDPVEWRLLRERLQLEGEARQFLTHPEARQVVAVSCTSRLELFDAPPPHATPEGELRFRNPSHPAAREAALAPAVSSSV